MEGLRRTLSIAGSKNDCGQRMPSFRIGQALLDQRGWYGRTIRGGDTGRTLRAAPVEPRMNDYRTGPITSCIARWRLPVYGRTSPAHLPLSTAAVHASLVSTSGRSSS